MSEEILPEEIGQTAQRSADEKELDQMELDVYRKAWAEINAALSEIHALRGGNVPESDPVQVVKSEVANLKKNFAELKDLILQSRISADTPQNVTPAQAQYQPAQAMPAVPLMPYYQTPSFAPIIQLPH